MCKIFCSCQNHEYTNHGNEDSIRKIDLKCKVQERRIKDYVKTLLKCLPDFFPQEQQNLPEQHLTWRIFPHTYSQENTYESVGMRPTAMRHAMKYMVGVMVCDGGDSWGCIITAIGQVTQEVMWMCHGSVSPLSKPHNLYNASLDVPQLHIKWLPLPTPHLWKQ